MMHPRHYLALILAVFLLLSFAGCRGAADVPEGMILASGDIVDYSLFVPEGWIVDQSGGVVSAYKSVQDPTSVSVMAWGLPYADSTLDDWWESYREEFDAVFTDFTLESTASTLLDGAAAQIYVYTGTLGENTYRYTQIAALRNTSVYLVTVTERADAETDHQEEISQIREAFRWK